MNVSSIAGRDELVREVAGALEHAPGGVLSLLLVEVRIGRGRDAGWQAGTAEAVFEAVHSAALGALEEGGTIRRTGGGTLAVVLPGAEPLFARIAADELVRRLAATAQELTGPENPPAVSGGLASAPQDAADADGTLRAARTALRAARRAGGIVTAQEALAAPTPEDVLISNLPPAVLAGRADALKSLERRMEVTRQEAGALVFLHGEPGIGKCTLLRRFLETAPPDASRLSVRLDPTSPYKPYEALVRALEAMFTAGHIAPQRVVRGLDEETRQSLAVLLPSLAEFLPDAPLAPNAAFRRAVFQGFAGILEQLGPQPLLLFSVFHAQWLDAASLELVSYLIRSRRRRLLLVGSIEELYLRGPDNQPLAVAELIEMGASIPFLHLVRLGRLSAPEMAVLAGSLLPGIERGGVFRQLERAAGGIPLGLVSALRLAAPYLHWDENRVPVMDGELPLPKTLHAQMEAAVESLDAHCRRSLGALALLARPATPAELAEVVGQPAAEMLDALEMLREEAFLHIEAGRYWFGAEHYCGVAEGFLGPEALPMHLAQAERAEKGSSELAAGASEDAASAYALLRRQAYALYHRSRARDDAGADRLRAGLRQASRLLYSPAEADEYMGGGAALPPQPQRATLEEEAANALGALLDASLEALAHVQYGASVPGAIPLERRISEAMRVFFAATDNLTLSFREGMPRACGQPLSARRYGDAPSLFAQFARARGVVVVCLDFRTKIDEWLWFLIGLGHEPNRIATPADWPYFLRDKHVRFIAVEAAAGFSGTPPMLARPERGAAASEPVTEARIGSPVRRRQVGRARSALFDTSVDLGAGVTTQSAEVAGVLSGEGVPLGVAAIAPDEKSVPAALRAVEKLLDAAHPADAAAVVERLTGGLEVAGASGRLQFYTLLPRLLPLLQRLPERSLYERLVRTLVRQLETEADGSVLAVSLPGMVGLVRFMVEGGHYDLARPLMLAAFRKGAPLRQALSEALARSDLSEIVAADLASEDPLRQAAVRPVAELLAQVLPTRFIELVAVSESYRVRKAAAGVVAAVEPAERDALVASALAAAGETERARMVEVLDTVGALATGQLEELLFDASEAVRSAAASLVARMDEVSVEELLARIEQHRGLEAALRMAVLASSGGSTTIVLKAVVQNDLRIQRAAAGALGILTRRGALPPRRALEALEALVSKAKRVFPDDPKEASALASAAIKALSLNPLSEAQRAIRSAFDFPDAAIGSEARAILGEEDEDHETKE